MPSLFTYLVGEEFTYQDQDLRVRLAEDGPYQERVVNLLASTIPLRSWKVPLRRTKAEALVVDAFFADPTATFYFQDPQVRRTAVSLGTGDGVTTTFSLPTGATSENFRDYTKHDGAGPGTGSPTPVVVRVSGSPVTVASVARDGRTITLAVAPGGSAPVEADYDVVRLCRLDARPEWAGIGTDWLQAVLAIREVMR